MNKVWVNGCFDVLHIGHIELLRYAKSLGTHLIVGIDSDTRVSSFKGPLRPFNKQEQRKKFLEELKSVTKVEIYDSDSELCQHLADNHIDIMVIGSDWKEKRIVGEKKVKKVIFFDRIEGYSTTRILNNEVCF